MTDGRLSGVGRETKLEPVYLGTDSNNIDEFSLEPKRIVVALDSNYLRTTDEVLNFSNKQHVDFGSERLIELGKARHTALCTVQEIGSYNNDLPFLKPHNEIIHTLIKRVEEKNKSTFIVIAFANAIAEADSKKEIDGIMRFALSEKIATLAPDKDLIKDQGGEVTGYRNPYPVFFKDATINTLVKDYRLFKSEAERRLHEATARVRSHGYVPFNT